MLELRQWTRVFKLSQWNRVRPHLEALAETRGRAVLLQIDKALNTIESSAHTIAVNTGGGVAAPGVEVALTWFNRQGLLTIHLSRVLSSTLAQLKLSCVQRTLTSGHSKVIPPRCSS